MKHHTISLLIAGVLGILFSASQARSASGKSGPSEEEQLTRTRMSTLGFIILQATTNGECPQSLEKLTFPPSFRPEHMPEVLKENQIEDFDNLLLDAWGNNFKYHVVTNATFAIHSAGPDGRDYTQDDIKSMGYGEDVNQRLIEPGTSNRFHVVKPEQDLFLVSLLWDVPVEVLQATNNLSGTHLTPGQTLIIPFAGR